MYRCTFGNEDWSIFPPLCLLIKRMNHLVSAAVPFYNLILGKRGFVDETQSA